MLYLFEISKKRLFGDVWIGGGGGGGMESYFSGILGESWTLQSFWGVYPCSLQRSRGGFSN